MAGAAQVDVTGRPLALRSVDLDRFFSPRTVAVIGASDAPGGPTTGLWRKIRGWGDRHGAQVIPVNPTRTHVDGVPAVASILEVEGEVDLAAILVGDAVAAFEVVLERKPAFAMIFGAGFAEAGTEGAARQERLASLVAASDTHLLGPNTNLNAFEDFRDDLPGPAIALITQSGHQGRPVFQAQELGIALSHWAPTGNEVDLEVADFLGWFADQPDIGAVAAYVEGFKDGRSLALAADRAARRGLPVVVVKVGRTGPGAAMARSHTGHLAGDDRVTDGFFAQYGIVRVDGLDELTDTAALLARAAPPTAPGVCVYGISGGTGAHLADLCAASGLDLPRLGDETIAALRNWIPDYLHVANPVDCGGHPVTDERGRQILDALVADPAIGVLICPITGALPTMSEPLARDLRAVAERTDKPICVIWGSPLLDDPAYAEVLVGSRCHVFRTFGNCVGAVRAYLDHHEHRRRYRSFFERPVLRRSPAAARAAPHLATAAAGEALSEAASAEVLAAYGIEVAHRGVATSATRAGALAREVGFPVVMKVCSSDLPHLSELGLVRTDVRTAAEARHTYRELVALSEQVAEGALVEGVVVAEQIADGTETVLGATHDDVFGPVVMFGAGGELVEILDDVAFRVAPFDRAEARRLVETTRVARLLRAGRGRRRGAVARVVDAIMAVQRLAIDHMDSIAEIDVNPLAVTATRAVALDALVVRR